MSSNSIERYREWARSIESDPLFVAEELKLAFADEVARMLESRKLKRIELAEKLGTNRGYVTRVLNTDYNLTIETMARIALALDARISMHMHPREAVGVWTDFTFVKPEPIQPASCWPKDCGHPIVPVAGREDERKQAPLVA